MRAPQSHHVSCSIDRSDNLFHTPPSNCGVVLYLCVTACTFVRREYIFIYPQLAMDFISARSSGIQNACPVIHILYHLIIACHCTSRQLYESALMCMRQIQDNDEDSLTIYTTLCEMSNLRTLMARNYLTFRAMISGVCNKQFIAYVISWIVKMSVGF